MASEIGTILVCEDNPSIRLLLKVFLQKRGWDTVIAEDGVDAVSLAIEHKPRLIMMDIIMPGKSGVEACADIRRAGVATPILILTSKSFAEDKDRALAAGANAFLLKPFNPADLEKAIQSLLAG
jgi:two-component system, OmpR family, response regulator